MSRARYVWDREAMRLVPAEDYYRRKYAGTAVSELPAPMVVSDVAPYRSMIDGSLIGGRRQHRDHLRAHGCIEVGNEWREPKPVPLPPVAPDIAKAIESESLRAEAHAAAQRAKEAQP